MKNDLIENSKICYLCGSNNTKEFFRLPPIPTMDGVMSPTREAAVNAITGEIILHYCKDCSYIGNEGYDPEKINFNDYDFSNAHSPSFAKHTSEICDRLINTYGIKGKTILDVGCGDGYFLKNICKAGLNKGIGIDPGFDYSKHKKNGLDLTFIRDYYSDQYAHLDLDLLTCRHVISVLEDPAQLVQSFRDNLAAQKDSIIYIDTPNAYHTYKDLVIWNVVYEHRSWFSPSSLKYLLEKCGFDVLNISTCWNDEYLNIEAKLSTEPKQHKLNQFINKEQDLESIILNFEAEYHLLKNKYEDKINRLREDRKRILAWGAGARSVSFFNLFDLTNLVPSIIDINEQRQGKYLPGTGQSIVSPEFMNEYQPDVVIITNPTYAAEIKAQIVSHGHSPEIWVL